MNFSRLMLALAAMFFAASVLCLAASCSCVAEPQPLVLHDVKRIHDEQVLPAEVTVKTRDARGRMFTPQTSPFGNEAVVAKRWQFTDANGRHFFGETLHVHPPQLTAPTEIPKLTEPEQPGAGNPEPSNR